MAAWKVAFRNKHAASGWEEHALLQHSSGLIRNCHSRLDYLADGSSALSGVLRFPLVELKLELEQLAGHIEQTEGLIQGAAQQSEACRRPASNPGIGALTATALIAANDFSKGITSKFETLRASATITRPRTRLDPVPLQIHTTVWLWQRPELVEVLGQLPLR